MAGVKGRSGGARPGAGRPRLTPRTLNDPSLRTTEPLEWPRGLMTLEEAGTGLRLEAAKALLSFTHRRGGGKA